jgi:hypothetical protein
MAPGRRAASAWLAVATAAVAVAAAAAVVPSATTTWASTSALGAAGSPTTRSLFISYISNWQFSTTPAFNGVPSPLNNNFYVLRACPGAVCGSWGPGVFCVPATRADAWPGRAEVFNPTCNTISLDGYKVLFGPAATAPVVGDGDWSQATAVPFPTGTTVPVRHTPPAGTCAAPAAWVAGHRWCPGAWRRQHPCSLHP